jgi:hypothetical protein
MTNEQLDRVWEAINWAIDDRFGKTLVVVAGEEHVILTLPSRFGPARSVQAIGPSRAANAVA